MIFANLINRFGDSIDSIAFSWLVYALTGNAAWSALIFAINKLPSVFLQPFAGAIVENKNHKMIIVVTNIIRGLCVGYVATTYYFGVLQPWMLIVTTLIISSVEAFCSPASMAIIPKILEKKYYDFGMSMNQSLSRVVELIGIGVAGVIIAVAGVSVAVLIDCATFIIAAGIIYTIRVREKTTNTEGGKADVKGYLILVKEGMVYLKDKKVLRNIVILMVSLNAMFVPFSCLDAPIIKDILHSGATMLSVLSIANTLGMLLGSFIYPYIAKKISGRMSVAIGGGSAGMAYIGLVLIGKFVKNEAVMYVVLASMMTLVGIGIVIMSMFVNIQFMKIVDEKYLARVGAMANSLGESASPVVSFITSAVLGIININYMFVFLGLIILTFIASICIFRMQLEENDIGSNTVIENINEINGREEISA